ncbi:MAG: hypothetical protein ACO1N0_03920 [Fluviicola sp.]
MKSSLMFILAGFFLLNACTSNEELLLRLKKDARELLKIKPICDFRSNQNKPVKDIVNIGDGLYDILRSRKKPVGKIEVHTGDLFGEDDDVTHSILYTSRDKTQTLMLRMRYDSGLDLFHIVGYSGKID